MSNQQSNSYSFSSTSYSYSSSSSGANGQQVSGQRAMESSYTDPSGQRTTTRAAQELGGPVVSEERRYDAQGREMIGGGGAADGTRRIEDVSDEEQAKKDRAYEEAIEEEYAKREGGA